VPSSHSFSLGFLTTQLAAFSSGDKTVFYSKHGKHSSHPDKNEHHNDLELDKAIRFRM
jgi:hypothetical protein